MNELELHIDLARKAVKPFGYDPEKPLAPQREAILKKYTELLGMPAVAGNAIPVVEQTETGDSRFDEIRFHYESEPGLNVPGHLLLPKGRKPGEKLSVVICLQGHSTGMHISLGRAKYEGDEETVSGGDRDFALQIVAHGYAAVAIEQRGMGEQKAPSWAPGAAMCHQAALPAFAVGRTLIGERAFDISRLIDALPKFAGLGLPFDISLDTDRIGLMGNSGGGTATYHTACVEPRIKVAMPSCAFNTYTDSIISMHHCSCNFIPGIVQYMEMPDLAMMIAPRPLVIVSGQEDVIFPIAAVNEGFEKVKKIYAAAGAPDNCRLVVGPEGHRFYAALAWPVFEEFI